VPPPLPLGLRNRLAELILDGFDDPAARETVAALATFCRSPDAELPAETAARLRSLDWFEPAGPGRVRLRGAHRAHREPLCRRAAAAAAMLAGAPPPPADALTGLLARAARLADAGLHFEVHELLEPAWLRAAGAERVALQGMIQVAVALHHEAHGNRAGALSLLAEGLDKLGAGPGGLPVATDGWCRELEGILAAWRAGAPAPSLPPWPAAAGENSRT
jgi:hypothetical protein